MDLTTYVESAQRQLAVLADPEGDNQAVAERMASALAPTIRLMLLEALSEAAEDITLELAPGSVEVRLRGGEPSFAVTSPLAAEPATPDTEPHEPDSANMVPTDIDDGPMTRINLRLSEQFKGRVEEAAEAEGRSVNAWLVRAAAIVLESRGRGSAARNITTVGKQRYTGWVR